VVNRPVSVGRCPRFRRVPPPKPPRLFAAPTTGVAPAARGHRPHDLAPRPGTSPAHDRGLPANGPRLPRSAPLAQGRSRGVGGDCGPGLHAPASTRPTASGLIAGSTASPAYALLAAYGWRASCPPSAPSWRPTRPASCRPTKSLMPHPAALSPWPPRGSRDRGGKSSRHRAAKVATPAAFLVDDHPRLQATPLGHRAADRTNGPFPPPAAVPGLCAHATAAGPVALLL
jgi:hypothetical protein